MVRTFLPTEFRGWIALGLFVQSSALFALMAVSTELLESQGFMTLASAVIVTAWVGAAVGYAYQMGKESGERTALANKALDLAVAATPSPAPPPAPDVVLQPGETAQAASKDGVQ